MVEVAVSDSWIDFLELELFNEFLDLNVFKSLNTSVSIQEED